MSERGELNEVSAVAAPDSDQANPAADRRAGEELKKAKPDLVPNVLASRAFLVRAVQYLTSTAGIRQFLDIGTGLPASNPTHEVAQQAAPPPRWCMSTTTPRSWCMHRHC
jgi:hypothetical protein